MVCPDCAVIITKFRSPGLRRPSLVPTLRAQRGQSYLRASDTWLKRRSRCFLVKRNVRSIRATILTQRYSFIFFPRKSIRRVGSEFPPGSSQIVLHLHLTEHVCPLKQVSPWLVAAPQEGTVPGNVTDVPFPDSEFTDAPGALIPGLPPETQIQVGPRTSPSPAAADAGGPSTLTPRETLP